MLDKPKKTTSSLKYEIIPLLSDFEKNLVNLGRNQAYAIYEEYHKEFIRRYVPYLRIDGEVISKHEYLHKE